MNTETVIGGAVTAALLTLVSGPATIHAQTIPTDIVVRAIANDAKIIGSGVGGAHITIRDVESGTVLAEGVQEGSTGNTDAIVRNPRERGATIFDTDGAGAFRATLELVRPTLVEIIAEGPLSTAHATQRASKTVLMVPGEDLVGEGILIVLNGFTVVIQAPTAPVVDAGQPVEVTANVTMLCGCPTQPGGLWDAQDIRITARLMQGTRVVSEAPMSFTGESSTYSATLTAPTSGKAELQVIAVDAGKANTGMANMEVRVR
jgi:hypothetical protein